MKTFKQHINEGLAYATGRWSDFQIDKLVHKDKRLRIYSGKRQGYDTQLFETQIIWKGKWRTIQYSTTMEEALNPEIGTNPKVIRQ